ncbi:MAG: adenylate kinase [Bacteroidetes bacterium]|nr:MAG: adenylate kinase [Bacteroidota bacterium]
MLNIVIFGPPGAGKGTQSQRLVDRYRLLYISTGSALREEIASGSPLGMEAETLISRGQLVPDEMVIGIIRKVIRERQENPEVRGILFDGFPRTKSQAEALDQMLGEVNSSVSCMVSLDVPQEVLLERILLRAQTSGRSDDNQETIHRRLEEYALKTKPVADFYRHQQKFHEVDGIGSVDEVADRLIAVIDACSNA